MLNFKKQNNTKKDILYNNILLLSRNKLFYTKFDLIDTFQNRINLIFIHISFLFIKIKANDKDEKFKIFYQEMFDLVFKRIELNMREIGYGDTTINNNMRFLVKSFYTILFKCEEYSKMELDEKINFLNKYLKRNTMKNTPTNKLIIEYFNKYEAFCFDLTPYSVLSGQLNFKYKCI
tara:strand:+ start:1375 stop:1905 length:531 start_codon:yes stop_codon:yes gene_type:complete